MTKVKKAQAGTGLRRGQERRLGRIAEKNPDRSYRVAERMELRKTREERGKAIAKSVNSRQSYKPSEVESKMVKRPKSNFRPAFAPKVKNAKNGSSFPDLNKDGKITKADILKGRGVIAKSGAMMKMGGKAAKQAAIAIAMKKAGKTPKKKMQYGGAAASMKPTSKIKKAQAGLTASNKRVGPIDPNGAFTKVQEMNLPPRNVKTKVSLTENKQLGATKMMKMGGGLKPVNKAKNPGLSKLPTPVRNKMGYQKNGGNTKKK